MEPEADLNIAISIGSPTVFPLIFNKELHPNKTELVSSSKPEGFIGESKPCLTTPLIINSSLVRVPVLSKQQKSILILNAKAHLGNGTVLENSAIGFKNGKIDVVTSANNVVKANYETIIDAAGKEIYPGFIAPNSTLGLRISPEVPTSNTT